MYEDYYDKQYLMEECNLSMRSKRRNQYQSDNRETNDKTKAFIHITMMINIFHDFEIVVVRTPLGPKFEVKF